MLREFNGKLPEKMSNREWRDMGYSFASIALSRPNQVKKMLQWIHRRGRVVECFRDPPNGDYLLIVDRPRRLDDY